MLVMLPKPRRHRQPPRRRRQRVGAGAGQGVERAGAGHVWQPACTGGVVGLVRAHTNMSQSASRLIIKTHPTHLPPEEEHPVPLGLLLGI